MSAARAARPLAAALTAGLLAATALTGVVLTATAVSGAVESPDDGAVITSPDVVLLRAEAGVGPSELLLRGPTAGAEPVLVDRKDVGDARTLAFDLDPRACDTWSTSGCSGGAALNGEYVVSQTGDTGQAEEPGPGAGDPEVRRFLLRVPPLPAREVTAAVGDGRTVTVTWRPGREADLTGYTVSDGAREVPVATADCTDRCAVRFTYDDAAPVEQAYEVRVLRSCGVEGCDDVASPAERTTARLPAAAAGPAPPGAPPDAGQPVTPGATPVDPSGVAVQQDAGRGVLQLPVFAPQLGVPALPALPTVPPLVAPDDGFSSTLDFGDEELPEVADPQAAPTATGRLVETVPLLVDETVAKSVAGALLLLLAGGHLQLWVRTPAREG